MKKLNHEKFMSLALRQAEKAYAIGEVPIGAIVVHENGTILGRGYNKMEGRNCQTSHAEVIAIQKACKKIGDWRLNDCWIYVTLEPCVMCMGLIQLSRMKGVIFGTQSPLFGFEHGNKKSLPTTKTDLVIQEGIKKRECTQILQTFFQEIRKRKGIR
ncbi:nucleoside deaminase [Candidatus Dependentiae bacterium]|nr:nucleoside deaminase [Candidatus Dependentiae bacterium]